ncbi:MAG: hypothetical protein MZV64_67200 [Ignavibacteriales bacterium]|nr:hypothetical protein [Ignavibacteriales bacterium]
MLQKLPKAFGIRIYTIGVGTRGEAPYPVQTPFGTRYQMVPVEIDEACLLKKLLDITGGQYFRATNNRALAEIYEKIDKLEKTKIEITSYKNASEKYHSWLWEWSYYYYFWNLDYHRNNFKKVTVSYV